ncbi:Lipopolysaccharide kinase (Kdo/WaaP) family protein [Coniochaeta hoffmannii]|uniref:Lipopolysaccharide kinase (Kdo/WaaP) family protein n=1 Tax=Coniochaeta hoffmannii TaxID=91930 RepID=A0AA38RUA7_9PEZI|nr:Lipopolysaccharide kinase (Kdo/WaaP) family protein [Coniochaeta hoffmannii]
MTVLPKSDIEILSQYIDDEAGYYRLRLGRRVHYVTIPSGVFDDDTMCRPYLLIPRLPDLPNSPWTTITISRDENGSLTSTISMDPLPEIQTTWHELRVDVLSLERTRRFRSGVYEVQYNGAPAIAKIACFKWDMARIERETWAYSIIARHHSQHPNESPITPDFLGHLTENGRTMGFLLQKVDGESACVDDLASCEALLRRLHRLGLIHGDVNRHNFLIDRVSGSGIRLVDFEHAEEFDDGLARAELLSLPAELAEETGRGATVVL